MELVQEEESRLYEPQQESWTNPFHNLIPRSLLMMIVQKERPDNEDNTDAVSDIKSMVNVLFNDKFLVNSLECTIFPDTIYHVSHPHFLLQHQSVW